MGVTSISCDKKIRHTCRKKKSPVTPLDDFWAVQLCSAHRGSSPGHKTYTIISANGPNSTSEPDSPPLRSRANWPSSLPFALDRRRQRRRRRPMAVWRAAGARAVLRRLGAAAETAGRCDGGVLPTICSSSGNATSGLGKRVIPPSFDPLTPHAVLYSYASSIRSEASTT